MISIKDRLQDKIVELDKVEKEVAQMSKENGINENVNKKLLEYIDKQKEVCKKELEIRNKMLSNKTEVENAQKAYETSKAEYNIAYNSHESLKNKLAHKYPQALTPIAGTKNFGLDPTKFSKEDQILYNKSKVTRDQKKNTVDVKGQNLKNAQNKVNDNIKEFNQLKHDNPNLYNDKNNNEGVANPCIPCIKNAIKKLSVFPGQQKYSNCGIQSASQIIELITCKKPDEDKLLAEAVKNKEARVRYADKPASDGSNQATEEERKQAVQILENGTPEQKIEMKKKFAIGGSIGKQRDSLLERNEVEMEKEENNGKKETPKYTREKLANALKNNKATIQSVDVSKLSSVEGSGWPSTSVGGHAVLISKGEFNDNGELTHVLVNDTGTGNQYRMTIKQLEDAHSQPKPPEMNITKNKIGEKCK